MTIYSVIHSHRFGISYYIFKSEQDIILTKKVQKKLIKELGIDFENREDEYLNLEKVGTDNIQEIKF